MQKPVAIFELNVGEPWNHFIFNGQKTIEGRKNTPKWGSVKVGDQMIIENIIFIVVRVTKYPSIKEYLENEGLEKTLPGIKTIESGVAIYESFYPKGCTPICAFEIKKYNP
jgi:ASC-1-like (ASCH) protein